MMEDRLTKTSVKLVDRSLPKFRLKSYKDLNEGICILITMDLVIDIVIERHTSKNRKVVCKIRYF